MGKMHEIKQTEQLKACPFCGGLAELKEGHHPMIDNANYYRVVCTGCGTTGSMFLDGKVLFAGELYKHISKEEAAEKAVEAWNRREQDDRRTQAEQEQKIFCNSLSADETASMMEAVKLFRYSDCGELRFSGNMARLYGCIPLDSDGDNLLNFLCTLYHYGRVQGIRSERARRKRGQQA